jgi:pyruvate-ferredoxin/flavodoxin oxidoreductase
MVIFCVERRKAWRILQSRVGVINHDYIAQKEIIKQIDSGEMSIEDYFNNGRGDGLEEKEELKQENV